MGATERIADSRRWQGGTEKVSARVDELANVTGSSRGGDGEHMQPSMQSAVLRVVSSL